MRRGCLKVATCQFPVSGDVRRNAGYIQRLIRKAASRKADVVHFCEAALTGYAGVDFPSFRKYDWDMLGTATTELMKLARECGIWVVLGCAHYIHRDIKPTNCLYVISNSGRLVTRYDKRSVTEHDEKHYSRGTRDVSVTINGVKLGLLICADTGNINLFRHYQSEGASLVLASFHNASAKKKGTYGEYVPARIRTRAYDYKMWLAANNSATRYSYWPTCIASPDGILVESLNRHETGMCICNIQKKKPQTAPRKKTRHDKQADKHPRFLDLKSLPFRKGVV